MPVQRWRFGGAGGRSFTSLAGGSSLVAGIDGPPFVDGADSAGDLGGTGGASTSLFSIIAFNQPIRETAPCSEDVTRQGLAKESQSSVRSVVRLQFSITSGIPRSEERRVGKECR